MSDLTIRVKVERTSEQVNTHDTHVTHTHDTHRLFKFRFFLFDLIRVLPREHSLVHVKLDMAAKVSEKTSFRGKCCASARGPFGNVLHVITKTLGSVARNVVFGTIPAPKFTGRKRWMRMQSGWRAAPARTPVVEKSEQLHRSARNPPQSRNSARRTNEMACFLSCPTWRWTSSCDHAATSSAVLYRSSSSMSGCASASVHRQTLCTETGTQGQFQLLDKVVQALVVQRQVSLHVGAVH